MNSRAMRRAYSAYPAIIQAGSLALSATRRSFIALPEAAALCCDCAGAAPRRRRRPELFEIVVGPHRRLHDVHNDVAGIDQHPFARRLAFDADDRRTCRLQRI